MEEKENTMAKTKPQRKQITSLSQLPHTLHVQAFACADHAADLATRIFHDHGWTWLDTTRSPTLIEMRLDITQKMVSAYNGGPNMQAAGGRLAVEWDGEDFTVSLQLAATLT
jgi:hypothetical protein